MSEDNAQAVVAVVTGNTMPSPTNYFTDGSAVPNPGQDSFRLSGWVAKSKSMVPSRA